MMRFQATGRVPQGIRPSSPLITLLEKIGGQYLGRILGLTVNESLGYSGSRQFTTGSQALNWLKPSDEVFGTFPADSWQIKNFNKVLTLDDLKASCSIFPESLSNAFPSLRSIPRTTRPKP